MEPQTIEEYNAELLRGLDEILSGDCITAADLKIEVQSWHLPQPPFIK